MARGRAVSNEQWKSIEGFGRYEISDTGRIRSFTRWPEGRVLRRRIRAKDGYDEAHLRDSQGVISYLSVHRLVLETFVGPCPEGMEARHLDGDPNNNDLANLCWGTHLENMRDRARHKPHLYSLAQCSTG